MIGSGPSVRERAEDINEFIEVHRPLVIECNVQVGIRTSDDHVSVFTNYRRLQEHIEELVVRRRLAVLGLAEVDVELAQSLEPVELYHYPYRVSEGRFVVEADGCTIPHDVVSMYAFALALLGGATSIFLCGFDGYLRDGARNSEKQLIELVVMDREMQGFFRLFRQQEWMKRGVNVASLTPTTYDVQQDSLYAYL